MVWDIPNFAVCSGIGCNFLGNTHFANVVAAVVAQLASAWLSEREVPGSILGDLNVCFDFPLIRVAIASNNRKTEH